MFHNASSFKPARKENKNIFNHGPNKQLLKMIKELVKNVKLVTKPMEVEELSSAPPAVQSGGIRLLRVVFVV